MTQTSANQPKPGAAQVVAELRRQLGDDFAHLTRNDCWVALALAAAVFLLSAWRIDATHAATVVNNCIFGADSVTFWRWLEEGNYLGLGVHKHTLAVLLVAILAQPLVWLGVSTLTAVTLAMGAIWGAVAAAAYCYFRYARLARSTAVTMTVLAMSSLGIASHSGIAETYGATLLVVALACLLLPAIARLADRHALASATMAGVMGAALALANAPATAFILLYFACLPFAKGRGLSVQSLGICVVIPAIFVLIAVIAPALAAEGSAGASWHFDYLGRYATFANFTDGTTIMNFLASVFVFAFVGPFDFLQCRFVASDLSDLIANPLRLAAYGTTISLVIFGIVKSVRTARRRETLGLLGATGSILIFYLYFNPDEALLYSPQWLLALFFAASPAFSRAWIWAGLAAALCLSVNLSPLHHPRTFDPELCCPNPPASMLPREMPAAQFSRSCAETKEVQ